MLPKLEPGITMVLMWAWTWRERKGAEACRRKLIGPMREMARDPPVVVDMIGSPPTMTVLQECRDIMALHCKSCGACHWKDEPP